MRVHRLVLGSFAAAGLIACNDATITSPADPPVHQAGINVPEAAGSPTVAFDRVAGDGNLGDRAIEASGNYWFFVPADFNGGIFGGSVDNHVEFEAHRGGNGNVTGRFHYVQNFAGAINVYSGRVTCLAVYDTPVLQRFPDIPAHAQNRAKWGGLVEHSTDLSEPAGSYIWFQSIDDDVAGHERSGGQPDLSTLSGFGDATANAAFCGSSNVPNPNFGPHAVQRGKIEVQ